MTNESSKFIDNLFCSKLLINLVKDLIISIKLRMTSRDAVKAD